MLSARIYIKSQKAVAALPATNFLFDCMPNLSRTTKSHCGSPGDASQAYDFLTTTGAPDESCSPIDASLGGNAQTHRIIIANILEHDEETRDFRIIAWMSIFK